MKGSYNCYMDKADRSLGTRLQNERKKRNLSQESLAERAGVSYSTVVKIENGINFGRHSTHQKLADTLGVSIASLVYGSAAPDVKPQSYKHTQKILDSIQTHPDLDFESKQTLCAITENFIELAILKKST